MVLILHVLTVCPTSDKYEILIQAYLDPAVERPVWSVTLIPLVQANASLAFVKTVPYLRIPSHTIRVCWPARQKRTNGITALRQAKTADLQVSFDPPGKLKRTEWNDCLTMDLFFETCKYKLNTISGVLRFNSDAKSHFAQASIDLHPSYHALDQC